MIDNTAGYRNYMDTNNAAKAAAYQNAPKANPFAQPQIPQAPVPQPPVAAGPVGGAVKPSWKKGGKVKRSQASKRADGIAQKGKTKGRFV